MRTVTPLLAAGLAATLTLTVSGCFGDTPSYNPAAEPTTAPLFASDEEALAAAEEAYRDYLKASDQILNEGGIGGERINQFASPALAAIESEGYAEAAKLGYKSVGMTNFDNAILQQFDSRSTATIEIIAIYVCTDRSDVDVVDSAGRSVVSAERADRKPHEVFFDFSASAPSKLVVSSIEQWTGGNTCG